MDNWKRLAPRQMEKFLLRRLIRGFPTHNKLSEAVPNHPVYLRHASGHASLANKKAMELFSINKDYRGYRWW